MIAKIISSAVVVLALGAGVAYAATQLASSNGTDVCVNQTNGLMRVTPTCRDGEYPMTIGGGSGAQVTSSGSGCSERPEDAPADEHCGHGCL